MEPIKFEENIKNKLEKRTIEPSENAWNKLSANLDAQEESSRDPLAWWLSIAATLVGIFLVTTLFFKAGEDNTVLPTLVETPQTDSPKLQIEVTQPEIIVKSDNKLIEEENNEYNKSNNITSNQILTKKMVKNESSKIKSEVVVYNVIEQESIENKEVVRSNSKNNNAINKEILAQIPEIEKEKDFITDAEIESLLESAEEDLVKNNNKLVRTKTTDANSLLQDVETDLEQSFRDKMFNTIISGYNTLKTAVAERND